MSGEGVMNIDRPLEDMIKEGRGHRRSGRGRGGRRGGGTSGGARRQAPKKTDPSRSAMVIDSKPMSGGIAKRRTAPKAEKGRPTALFSAAAAQMIANDARLTGVRVVVSNLAPAVTSKDVDDLFSGVGPLQKAEVEFDKKNHRSTGNAEVIFKNRKDALEAIKRYNQVPLDNRPLKLSLSTTRTNLAGAPIVIKSTGSQKRTILGSDAQNATQGRKPGQGRSGRRRGRGGGGGGSNAMAD